MSEVFKPAPKPVSICGRHLSGSVAEAYCTGLVIDGTTSLAYYYTVKEGMKLKIYEYDHHSEGAGPRAYLEVSPNVTTTPIQWLKAKGMGGDLEVHRTFRYPLIIEAYDYDHGLRFGFVQKTAGLIDISIHGETSPLS